MVILSKTFFCRFTWELGNYEYIRSQWFEVLWGQVNFAKQKCTYKCKLVYSNVHRIELIYSLFFLRKKRWSVHEIRWESVLSITKTCVLTLTALKIYEYLRSRDRIMSFKTVSSNSKDFCIAIVVFSWFI